MTGPMTPAAATAPTASTASAAPFRHALRVYLEDTDAGGVVFYANYLKFFERARTEWLRALGFGQQALRESTGALFVVTDTRVRYLAPARLDDLLQVTVHLRAGGKASMTLVQQAWARRQAAGRGRDPHRLRRRRNLQAAPHSHRIHDHHRMTQDLSITALVLQASLVVQIVMAGLAITSFVSWTVIFGKLFGLKRVRRSNDDFEREFWSGRSLTELHEAVLKKPATAAMERIFASGMREFLKLREKRLDAGAQLDGARRAMRASFQRELDVVESNLSFLASVGSVSPYVGLFGTVWGIMHAFVGLSNLQQVTLATVAPGIAEALVATAIGLFAAIPAVVAYNRFARDIDRIAIQLETFIEEFSNILQRNAGQVAAAGTAIGSEVR